MTTSEAIELIKAIEQSLEVLGEAMLIHNNALQEMRTRIEAIEEQLDNAIKFSRS
jgi:predicted  nucleic acid-binding Zn-ribbon protein